MNTKRSYTMGARAAAVEETRRRILDTAVELSTERRIATISLDDIASAAGVSVQTLLRQFGSRAGLIDAAGEHARAAVRAERRTPVGDVAAAVGVVVEHYEDRGRSVLLLLAQETDDPVVAPITAEGKRLHRAWVEDVFAPFGPDEALLDLLVVATDVYSWKLLRLDRGLSRATTRARMLALVEALLATIAS